jgi:hypothetical protein
VGVFLTKRLFVENDPVAVVESTEEPFLSGSLDLAVVMSVKGLGIFISNIMEGIFHYLIKDYCLGLEYVFYIHRLYLLAH